MRSRSLSIDRPSIACSCRAPLLATGPATLKLCLLALCTLTLPVGCSFSFPGQPNPADRPVPDNEIASFPLLYKTHCAGCHGADGRFGPAPPLNDPIFLAIVSNDELLHLINHGRPGTPMPAFAPQHGGPLTEEQVKILAEGIKPHWSKPEEKGAESAKVPQDLPPYALTPLANETERAEAVARGRQRFAQACGDCHGPDGEGTKEGPGAVSDPDFLALASDQMLRRIIITGRPDLGMPNFTGTDGRSDGFQPLSSAEIDDLVALLAHWRTSNPGQTDHMAGRTAAAPPGGRQLDHFTRRQNR